MSDLREQAMTADPLGGRTIVITRPAGQAAHLAERLVALGARPLLFPVLAIEDIDPQALLDVAIRLDSYDWAVFVSPNAVEKALAVILARRAWPRGLRVATVGESSKQALISRGIVDVLAPVDRFDSEALLALPEFADVAGRRVVIFRGESGRDLFGDALRLRGALVDYVACYRRVMPRISPDRLLRQWEAGQLHAVTLTSSEGARNFWQMIGKLGQGFWRHTPTFVPHARIMEQVQALGIREVILTPPADAGLIEGLLRYFSQL